MAWKVEGFTERQVLGEGASGRVVMARHDGTDQLVAIKYLSESLRRDSEFVRRFRGEAELLADIDSPHVTRLYEYVEQPEGAAIVMELVNGLTLRTLLDREGATGPEAALLVLKGSLLGLAAAHAKGVVHRDYKPANVLVDPGGESRLVDFGIAMQQGRSGPGVSGTPRYMAPEQWTGAPAAPSTDIYAATATLLECLTGAPPFPGNDLVALAMAHESAPVPVDGVPVELRALVQHGLAKSASNRPADAIVMLDELERIATATYGQDWEERGRANWAARVALLALLLPFGGAGAGVGSALATSVLPRLLRPRPLMLMGAGTVAAVIASVLILSGPSAPRTESAISALPVAAASVPEPVAPAPAPEPEAVPVRTIALPTPVVAQRPAPEPVVAEPVVPEPVVQEPPAPEPPAPERTVQEPVVDRPAPSRPRASEREPEATDFEPADDHDDGSDNGAAHRPAPQRDGSDDSDGDAQRPATPQRDGSDDGGSSAPPTSTCTPPPPDDAENNAPGGPGPGGPISCGRGPVTGNPDPVIIH